MLVEVVDLFEDVNLIEVDLKVDPEVDLEVDLKGDPQLRLEYDFRKHQ